MIKLRVETVARDGLSTLPGRSQFQKSGRTNRPERGCQGTGSIVENQIRQPSAKCNRSRENIPSEHPNIIHSSGKLGGKTKNIKRFIYKHEVLYSLFSFHSSVIL